MSLDITEAKRLRRTKWCEQKSWVAAGIMSNQPTMHGIDEAPLYWIRSLIHPAQQYHLLQEFWWRGEKQKTSHTWNATWDLQHAMRDHHLYATLNNAWEWQLCSPSEFSSGASQKGSCMSDKSKPGTNKTVVPQTAEEGGRQPVCSVLLCTHNVCLLHTSDMEAIFS